MIAVGFSLAALLAYRRAQKFGLREDDIADLLVLLLVTGIIGGRILYVLLNLGYYVNDPLEVLNLTKGGLVWYGGFGAALLAGSLFIKRRRRMNFWTTADLIAPYIALAQAFGRIGCYLNGCCYGIAAPSHYIFGGRHPTQVYSALALFIIFIIVLRWQDKRRFSGEAFLGYCMLYSCKRFFIEFLRADNPRIILDLTMSQLVGIAAFIAAAYLFKLRMGRWRREGH
jgi:phosphatidylglycerol:prolipoprotein diacylglycerol transferase